MAKPGITPQRGRKPRVQKVTIRSASHHLAGAEQPYPVYQFSRRAFLERKGHNPFALAGLRYTGTHTTPDGIGVLIQADFSWPTNDLVGNTLRNITDGSEGIITANIGNVATATLAGGTENEWDTGDVYEVWAFDNG